MLADLSPAERGILEWLLPADKPFYSSARSRLDVLELSRSGNGDAVFGKFDDDLAETIAIGEIGSPSATVTLRMDELGEGAMLSIPELSTNTQLVWTLSTWSPGSDAVREIRLQDATGKLHFVFALSPVRRVLWLHHATTGYNQLLPVTGVFVELARLKRTPSTGRLSHDGFFELAERSSDDVLMEALLEYNKRARKFDASKVSIQTGNEERSGGFNFLRNWRKHE